MSTQSITNMAPGSQDWEVPDSKRICPCDSKHMSSGNSLFRRMGKAPDYVTFTIEGSIAEMALPRS